MAPTRVPVSGSVLRWAREQSGSSVTQVADRLKVRPARVAEWEAEQSQPTVNQLRQLANYLQRTPASFLLVDVPNERGIERPADFRGHEHDAVEPALLREVRKADERRTHYLDLVAERPLQPVTSDIDIEADPSAAARQVRGLLGVSLPSQLAWRTDTEALRPWIAAIEDFGALVFQMSRIDLRVARGASLFREPLPIILLNGADSPYARVFTLMHELGHLLMRQSGICDVWADNRTEQFCNRFAGELLLPREHIEAELAKAEPLESLDQIATRYSVSQSAVAVRLRQLELIDQADLNRQLELAAVLADESRRRSRERSRESGGGPPHHRVHLRNLGENYVATVLRALDSDRISAVDAAYFLEAKLGTIENMRDDLVGSGRAS